jgi:hypothetical protein
MSLRIIMAMLDKRKLMSWRQGGFARNRFSLCPQPTNGLPSGHQAGQGRNGGELNTW